MSVLDTYDQITTTWARARADVTSHFVALGLLALAGIQLPTFPDPPPLDQLFVDPRFKLVEKVGFTTIFSVTLALGLGIYAALLQSIREFMARVALLLWPIPPPPIPSMDLTQIAASIDNENWGWFDLDKQIDSLFARYIPEASNLRDQYGLFRHTFLGARQTWFKNAIFFLTAWLALIACLPHASPFLELNRANSSLATLALTGFVLVARIRLVRGAKLVREFQAAMVSLRLSEDQRVSALSVERRQQLRERVDRERQRYEYYRVGPSLTAFVCHAVFSPIARKVAHRLQQPSASSEADRVLLAPNWVNDFDRPGWLRLYVRWKVKAIRTRVRDIFQFVSRRVTGRR